MPATLLLRRTVISRSGPRTTTATSPGLSIAPNRTTEAPVKPVVIAIKWLVKSAARASARTGTGHGNVSASRGKHKPQPQSPTADPARLIPFPKQWSTGRADGRSGQRQASPPLPTPLGRVISEVDRREGAFRTGCRLALRSPRRQARRERGRRPLYGWCKPAAE